MEFPSKHSLLGTLVLSTLLTACGGGGGGGGSKDSGDRGTTEPPLTTLPTFLQAATAKCTFTESGNSVSLVDYRGTLANVTALNCNGATLADLNGIEQLTALQELNVPGAGLTSVDELLAMAAQLKSLDLGENALSGLVTVSQLTALENLDLSGMGLADISALVSMANLTLLDLSDNRLVDLTTLTALQNLEQVDLAGNSILNCAEVYNLRNSLESATKFDVVVPPAQCAFAVNLTDASTNLRTINNSTENPRLNKIVITGAYDFDDLVFAKSGNDLTFTLTSLAGKKALLFTDWFVDTNHTVQRFVMPDGEEYSFLEIRRYVPIYENLGAGDDIYNGNSGDDVVDGGDGNDVMDGSGGSDTLFGGDGNDVIRGNQGTDYLTGGPGNDILVGDNCRYTSASDYSCPSKASDSTHNFYYYNRNDGQDVILESYAVASILVFGDDISLADIIFVKDDVSLVLKLSETESITVFRHYSFAGSSNALGFIQFQDGPPLQIKDLLATHPLLGTDAADTFLPTGQSDIFLGLGGDDFLIGGNGEDQLDGGDNNDFLRGDDDSDILKGGPGNDVMIGSYASYNSATEAFSNIDNDQNIDFYQFGLGDGQDIVLDYDAAPYQGVLQFGAGITAASLSMQRVGDNLVINVSPADSVTIYRWFDSSYFKLSQFDFSGQESVDADTLVNAKLGL